MYTVCRSRSDHNTLFAHALLGALSRIFLSKVTHTVTPSLSVHQDVPYSPVLLKIAERNRKQLLTTPLKVCQLVSVTIFVFYRTELNDNEYHEKADQTLESLTSFFEDIGDNFKDNLDYDVTYSVSCFQARITVCL